MFGIILNARLLLVQVVVGVRNVIALLNVIYCVLELSTKYAYDTARLNFNI